uniref:Cytochrome c biogenesis protein CcsB n=1 Tax=Dicranema revolutum TaxID=239144 RepID=A0A4D6WTV7_9FLOR|nr:cytochrome c biogenesis protein ccs1 [Dicranema revolutum]
MKWNIIKQISNLNFSILLLLIIASISILGTIIEQDQSIQYYQINYPNVNSAIKCINWKIITYLGLNHIYTNWWFLCLLLLFFLSLLTCTFFRQLPSLYNARKWKFIPPNDNSSSTVKSLTTKSLTHIIYVLNSNKYYIFQKNNRLYAYKGLIGRIAPVFVHISLISTLIGSVLGLFGGFTAQQLIPIKETFHIHNSIKSGIYSQLPYNILGKIDDFFIEYNADNSIKQFYSKILLMNNQGKYLTNKVIHVNSPLQFNGVTFYQTAWDLNAIRIKIDNNFIQQKLEKTKTKNTSIWVYAFKFKNPFYLVITGLNNTILMYNHEGNLIQSIKVGEKFTIYNHNIIITEIMASTGIQIKTDPGNSIVYLGFLILIINTTFSYIPYCEIWIHTHIETDNKKMKIKGITNRGELTFEAELSNIHKTYLKIN